MNNKNSYIAYDFESFQFVLIIKTMKRLFFISIISFFVCCQKQPSEIRYYPSNLDLSIDTLELIRLDTTSLKFKQLTDKIADFDDAEYQKTMFEFKDGNILKRITPYTYGLGHYKENNVLAINNDSIFKEGGFPISMLSEKLKKHYTNNGESRHYARSTRKALVEIAFDTSQTAVELEKVLVKLTRAFDEVKEEISDSIQLKLYLSYMRNIMPPPPPPETNDDLNLN